MKKISKKRKSSLGKSADRSQGSAFKRTAASTNPDRPKGKGKGKGSNMRSAATIRRLNMYRDKPNVEAMKKKDSETVRIDPNRRWFTNTRVITQDKLTEFRSAMETSSNDAFSVVLKRARLPVSLVAKPDDRNQKIRSKNMLAFESFSDTFGKSSKRRRPRLASAIMSDNLSSFVQRTEDKLLEFEGSKGDSYPYIQPDIDCVEGVEESRDEVGEEIFKKGTSRRIWQELYKVVDSADVLIEVLDARDPVATRCLNLEKYIRKDRPHKHICLLLNKCDLVPTWVTRRWLQLLNKECPTVAFHASISNSFGKQTLFSLLRQYSGLLKDKQHVSIGFIGLPNVGKSSIINTLKKKKVCTVAPVPGHTRVWQFVSLTHRIHLIDCPGIVPNDLEIQSDASKLIFGIVRPERVKNPEEYIPELLKIAKKDDLLKKYDLPKETVWKDEEEFLTLISTRLGKLRKGGDPDTSLAARMIFHDWQKGKISFYRTPPSKAKPSSSC